MENVVIKKRKKLNVKNLCLLIFFLVMLIVFLFSLIKVIMWIIDNSNTNDIIKKDGTTISYEKKIYIMLNKPKGYITANFDKNEKTVMELINHPRKKDLFPVGRLDKDTTGLLLITNNGKIAHELLSPKKHVEKTYIVKTDGNMDIAEKTLLENGVVLDGELTKKAKVKVFSDKRKEETV